MSVENLLGKLVTRTISVSRRAPAAAHSLELSLAKSLIEALGTFKAAHPEFTDEMATGALRMVGKCLDENAGAIN
jgi:hypothetical protein